MLKETWVHTCFFFLAKKGKSFGKAYLSYLMSLETVIYLVFIFHVN